MKLARGAGRLLATTVAAVLILVSCDSDAPPAGPADGPLRHTPLPAPTGEDSRVIGFVGTLSGPDSWRGEDAFEGADLGVHVLNRDLEATEQPFELVALDDAGDAARAGALVAQLAASDQMVGIVYAGPTQGLPPTEPALAQAGIPAVLCYGDLYSAQLLTPHIFQASPPLLWQARRIAAYLVADRRYTTIGAMVEASLDGRAANTSLQSSLLDRGERLREAVNYSDRRADLRTALEALKRHRVEAIVVQGGPRVLPAVLRGLRAMHAAYRDSGGARIASATRKIRRARLRAGHWRPQIIGFDTTAAVLPNGLASAGTVAADTYARGAHYLPLPSLRSFRTAFQDWWGSEPLGWERRAFEAVGLIGWAARRGENDDLALALEDLRRRRFGGLAVTLGPDDHTTVEQTDMGLWVVPRDGIRVTERDRVPGSLPWVLLARGFSIDGAATDISPEDWDYLFMNPPPRDAPPPKYRKMLFGVKTSPRDPVH